MTKKLWNKNVRFNTNSDSAMRAGDLIHSEEVEELKRRCFPIFRRCLDYML